MKWVNIEESEDGKKQCYILPQRIVTLFFCNNNKFFLDVSNYFVVLYTLHYCGEIGPLMSSVFLKK